MFPIRPSAVTPAKLVVARAFWEAGAPVRPIARGLGVSHNAILGHARRLRWPPRPHPITGAVTPRCVASTPSDGSR